MYSCVLRLASHLLRRGGVTAIESLYEFYLSGQMPPDIRAAIGECEFRVDERVEEMLELHRKHPLQLALVSSS